jgi:hypothetical protein
MRGWGAGRLNVVFPRDSAVWTKQRERLLGAGGALLVTPAALEAAETIEAHRKAGVTDY